MSDPRAAIAALAREFGADPAFCRAGGGNCSAKVDGVLHLKPSGVALAHLGADDLIALDRAALVRLLDDPALGAGSDPVLEAARAARVSPDDGRRPSVELLFHALIPDRYVLHTHPTIVNSLTCAAGGAELAAELFADDALWIPYVDPGLPLARAIRDARVAHERRTGRPAPGAYLLQSHGLIVASDDDAAVAAGCRSISERVAARIDAAPPGGRRVVERLDPITVREAVATLAPALARRLGMPGSELAVHHDPSELALVAAGSELGRRVAAGGPLTPDQIVYAGSFPLLLERPTEAALDAALAARAAAGIEPPIVVLVAGVGLIAVGVRERDAATAASLYLDGLRVAIGADRLGGIRFLAPAERRFIEEWEAEAYRKGVSRATR